MSEPQLERSVLEAKEREELFAIADALGTRPVTRARKGDLISAILRATGVEVGDDPEPPRRTRARKAAASSVGAVAASSVGGAAPAAVGGVAAADRGVAAADPGDAAGPADASLVDPGNGADPVVSASGDGARGGAGGGVAGRGGGAPRVSPRRVPARSSSGTRSMEERSTASSSEGDGQLSLDDAGSSRSTRSPAIPAPAAPSASLASSDTSSDATATPDAGALPDAGGAPDAGAAPDAGGSPAGAAGADSSETGGVDTGPAGADSSETGGVDTGPEADPASITGQSRPSGGGPLNRSTGPDRGPTPGRSGGPSTSAGRPPSISGSGGPFERGSTQPYRRNPGASGGAGGGGVGSGGGSGPGRSGAAPGPRGGRPTPTGDARSSASNGQDFASGRSVPARSAPANRPIPAASPPANVTTSPDGVAPVAGEEQGGEGVERPRFDNESGNRRNRRRRGRDRADRPERELPGQGAPDAPFTGEPLAVQGYLDLRDEGYGFLRTLGYSPSNDDVYVSISQARRFALRKGDWVQGAARPATATEKYPALLRVDKVGGTSPDDARGRPRFDDLVAVSPDQLLALSESDDATLAVRVIDIVSPLGRGQRGLLTGPPKSGKTTILTDIVKSLEQNHPELELLVMVIDERPEEVTDLRRAVRSDVIATTFDRPAEEHVQVAELVVERAKRLAEQGGDVVVIVDGLTRLARAYNLVPAGTGRVLPGGIDAGALHHPKRFFAAARNIEGGGSLTILATALVGTGSRTDEVIYEELNGTANMELRLDARLAARRIYPAVDVRGSSTRHEERLLDGDTLEHVWAVRRLVDTETTDDTSTAVQSFLERLRSTGTNKEFLVEAARDAASGV